MSLKLPRLPQNPPSHAELQIWWQQVCEAIEGQEAVQEELDETQSDLIADLQATQETLTETQVELSEAQDDIEAAVGDLGELTGALDAANTTLAALAAGSPYVSQDVGPAWAAATGAASRATFATYTAPTISAAYVQAEVQAIAAALQVVSQALKAIIDDLLANRSLTPP